MTKFSNKLKISLIVLTVTLLAVSCNSVAKNPTPVPVSQTQEQTVKVYQSVQGSNFNSPDPISVPAGQSALQLLKSKHQVQTKDFGKDLGEFVESVDGIAPAKDQFWAFYVNGQSSSVGASAYTLKDGDRIEWKLEKINQ